MTDIESIIEKLSQDATPIAPARHPYVQCAKWILGFAAYLAVLLFFLPPRPDLLVKLHAPLFAAEIGTLILIVITTALSAALLSFPILWQKTLLAFTPLMAFIAFIIVMILAFRADSPPAPAPEHEMFCTVGITLFALIPAIWMFITMRKAASTHAGISGYIATLCAFSLGALTLRLAEQTDSISHVLAWHYLPIFGLSMIGIGLGKHLLKW